MMLGIAHLAVAAAVVVGYSICGCLVAMAASRLYGDVFGVEAEPAIILLWPLFVVVGVTVGIGVALGKMGLGCGLLVVEWFSALLRVRRTRLAPAIARQKGGRR